MNQQIINIMKRMGVLEIQFLLQKNGPLHLNVQKPKGIETLLEIGALKTVAEGEVEGVAGVAEVVVVK